HARNNHARCSLVHRHVKTSTDGSIARRRTVSKSVTDSNCWTAPLLMSRGAVPELGEVAGAHCRCPTIDPAVVKQSSHNLGARRHVWRRISTSSNTSRLFKLWPRKRMNSNKNALQAS
ncbi:unnamed protein product, partial [Sphacelaria rigidula]